MNNIDPSEPNTKPTNSEPVATTPPTNTRCGFVAIIGRPNVGKSTLLNSFVAQKISITADKPQTTRHRILGIKTINDAQAVYIDTPGIHDFNKKKINQYMNKAALSALHDVDLILFVVEAMQWHEMDQAIVAKLQFVTCPVILVVNKIDMLADKTELLPYLQQLNLKANFAEIMPIAAFTKLQVAELQQLIFNKLPASPFYFPENQTTNYSEKFRLAELLREQLTRQLEQELPYAVTVEIEKLETTNDRTLVHAIIWVERDSQKKIIIGTRGAMLKKIAMQTRLQMNRIVTKRVHLEVWVKVRSGWTDDSRALEGFGYN